MALSNGWIKIHRKFQEWEWYNDIKVSRLFLHLLLNANIKDSRYKGHEVPRGSLVIGLNALSVQTGLSVRSIRTALHKLKTTNETTIKSTNKFSIISITNYDQYQSSDKQNDKQTTNKRQTNDNIIRKQESKKKEKDVVQAIVSYLNDKTCKSFKFNSKKTMSVINARLNEGYTIDDFKQVIDTKVEQWSYDAEMKKYLRPETLFGNKMESYMQEGIRKTEDQMMLELLK